MPRFRGSFRRELGQGFSRLARLHALEALIFCQPEIENLDGALRCDLYVRRLEIAMKRYPVRVRLQVRRRSAARCGALRATELGRRQFARRASRPERSPSRTRVCRPSVRSRESPQYSDGSAKPVPGPRASAGTSARRQRQSSGENFQSNVAMEDGVVRAVHLTHSAHRMRRWSGIDG